MPLGHAAGGLADGHEPNMGGVLDGLTAERDLMLRRDWLCRVVDRLHLFAVVIEAIEVVGRASGCAPALCEGSHTRGGYYKDGEAAKRVVKSSLDSHGMAPWLRAPICVPVKSHR